MGLICCLRCFQHISIIFSMLSLAPGGALHLTDKWKAMLKCFHFQFQHIQCIILKEIKQSEGRAGSGSYEDWWVLPISYQHLIVLHICTVKLR